MGSIKRKRDNFVIDLIALKEFGVYIQSASWKCHNKVHFWRLRMRQLLLLLSVLLLGASWAAAQDTSGQTNPNAGTPSQTSSTSEGGETTVQGCLSGSSGAYTLTDKNGNSYQLTGDSAKLSEHVGTK
jgi:hypothetical protein